jgi:hypothetical protein
VKSQQADAMRRGKFFLTFARAHTYERTYSARDRRPNHRFGGPSSPGGRSRYKSAYFMPESTLKIDLQRVRVLENNGRLSRSGAP